MNFGKILFLQNTEKKQVYFARKFEPIINLSIIDTLEVWLYGEYPAGNTHNCCGV